MRSMTGYGSGKTSRNGWEVTVDLKTVNHRFLDIGLRLPRNLSFLEQDVRERIGKSFHRGHVDLFISVNRADSCVSSDVICDEDLAARYYSAACQIAERTGVPNDLTVSGIVQLEGVLSLRESDPDEEAILSACLEAVDEAAKQVNLMRDREGAHLRDNLSSYLEQAALLHAQIAGRAPAVVQEYRNKLNARIRNVLPDGIDPQRLAQEVALMADRCAIDEELARLNSHFSQMRKYFVSEGEIGKKMDFLIQEMNREANTIGSKASDAEIAQHVVNLKSEIEKMREQIQNVE